MPQAQQFEPTSERIQTPTKIGSLKLILARGYGEIIPELDGDPTEVKNGAFFEDLSVLDQNGHVMDWKRGELMSFLTDEEKQSLNALMNRLWALAEDVILP